ncbi:MAG: hypothetical protein KDA87_26975 [Planctomycetales bacterium]|nr:hypothetical protein [Planctomycetales bacterium]
MKRIGCQRAISTLEACGILVVVLPVLVVSAGLMNYMYEINLVKSLVDEYVNALNERTLHIQTGEQDYFMRARKSRIQELLEENIAELESDLDRLYGTANYLAETAYAAYQISPQSGQITGMANVYAEGGGHEDALVVLTRGSQTDMAHLEQTLKSIYSAGVGGQREIVGDSTMASIFSRPSGLKGARAQIHYGPSHIMGQAIRRGASDTYRPRYPHSNYYRTAVAVGVAVSVDFSGTFTGHVLAMLGVEPSIRDHRISSPVQDF